MTGSLPGIRRRLASLLYESLLVLGVLSIGFMIPEMGLAAAGILPSSGVTAVHLLVVVGAYFIWYWMHGGQTLAMQTWKLQLMSVRGTPPLAWQVVVRYLLAWPCFCFFGAGVVWALFDRDRQFLHDRLAGTRIVFKR
ncbi:MAG: RDD family protein [Proteobacteria bacterium]|nr:RDD family protein [Pseudomonadota bacterium]HQR02885.1 RDD family protein [Rhodocyclaceae bacterium]